MLATERGGHAGEVADRCDGRTEASPERPGYSRPLIRADQYRELVDEFTYRDDRVRPMSAHG